jgi:hypothetical protein
VRDFGSRRSTTWRRDEQAADAGKLTVTEMMPEARSGAPVPRKVEAAPILAMPTGPRPTIADLFGAVQQRAEGADPDTAAIHTAAKRGTATASSSLPYGETIQGLFGHHDVSSVRAHTGSDARETGMSREASLERRRTGSTSSGSQAPRADTHGEPGKRTLTEAVGPVQAKLAIPMGAGGSAPGGLDHMAAHAAAERGVATPASALPHGNAPQGGGS